LQQAREDVKLICIETDAAFAKLIKQQYPQVDVYNDSAENLQKCLDESNVESVCLVISGIPFAGLTDELQQGIMTSIHDCLRSGGEFTTFSYIQSPYVKGGKRYQNLLGNLFTEYKKDDVVWRNIPPAFWYRAIK